MQPSSDVVDRGERGGDKVGKAFEKVSPIKAWQSTASDSSVAGKPNIRVSLVSMSYVRPVAYARSAILASFSPFPSSSNSVASIITEFRCRHRSLRLTGIRSFASMAPLERLADKLEAPALDDRSYRVVRLPNKLEALLVHDPDTDKASAAVNVNVGSFSDAEDMPGMAHAVEHLLFMGTKKVGQASTTRLQPLT